MLLFISLFVQYDNVLITNYVMNVIHSGHIKYKISLY